MQGSNFTDELRAQGLRSPNELMKVWEVSPQIGGPFVQDKLWYSRQLPPHGHAQHGGRHVLQQERRRSDEVDLRARPRAGRAIDDGTSKSASLRLTLQASPKNKFNIFWDEQDRKDDWIGGGSATTSPEAAAIGSSAHPDSRRTR